MKMKLLFGIWLLASTAYADVSVKTFGAVGNGLTDDTGAVQTAINLAVATSDTVIIPAGTYRISASLVVNGGIAIRGTSETVSVILPVTGGQDAFQVTTIQAVHFQSFTIRYPFAQVVGSAIKVKPAIGINSESTFERVRILNCSEGFSFFAASDWHLDSCSVFNWTTNGVHIQVSQVAEGNSDILACTFVKTSGFGGTAIVQQSPGGLRVANSIIQGGDYGYLLSLAPGLKTSDVQITGCAIEGQRVFGVFLVNQGPGTFSQTIISANEFNLQNHAIATAASFGVPWMFGMTIIGNTITLNPSGGVAIELDGISGPSVSGNSIRSTGGTTFGVVLRPATQNGNIGINSMVGITFPLSNFGLGNKLQ